VLLNETVINAVFSKLLDFLRFENNGQLLKRPSSTPHFRMVRRSSFWGRNPLLASINHGNKQTDMMQDLNRSTSSTLKNWSRTLIYLRRKKV